jgi:hypothetical protein
MNINDLAGSTTTLAGLTGAKFTSTAYSSSNAAAGDLSGAVVVVCNNSGATPGTLTTRTAAQMIADSNLQVGQTYFCILANGQATGTLTLAGGTGVTITGTATVAANTARLYTVTINTATTLTFQNVAGGITAP